MARFWAGHSSPEILGTLEAVRLCARRKLRTGRGCEGRPLEMPSVEDELRAVAVRRPAARRIARVRAGAPRSTRTLRRSATLRAAFNVVHHQWAISSWPGGGLGIVRRLLRATLTWSAVVKTVQTKSSTTSITGREEKFLERIRHSREGRCTEQGGSRSWSAEPPRFSLWHLVPRLRTRRRTRRAPKNERAVAIIILVRVQYLPR